MIKGRLISVGTHKIDGEELIGCFVQCTVEELRNNRADIYCDVKINAIKKPEEMTVKTIIQEYLRENGFDGLCGSSCGCATDELILCENPSHDCQPAYKVKKNCSSCEIQCDSADDNKEGHCFKVKND